jgi:hypothetical protein
MLKFTQRQRIIITVLKEAHTSKYKNNANNWDSKCGLF